MRRPHRGPSLGFPEGPQVEGGGQQAPFALDRFQAPQQKPACSHLFFQDAEYRFHQPFTPTVCLLGLRSLHPTPVLPKGHVVGTHLQHSALSPVLGAYAKGRADAASGPGRPVHPDRPLVSPLGEVGEGQGLSLGASVVVGIKVVGKLVFVVGMRRVGLFLGHGHRRPFLFAVCKIGSREIPGVGQGQGRGMPGVLSGVLAGGGD